MSIGLVLLTADQTSKRTLFFAALEALEEGRPIKGLKLLAHTPREEAKRGAFLAAVRQEYLRRGGEEIVLTPEDVKSSAGATLAHLRNKGVAGPIQLGLVRLEGFEENPSQYGVIQWAIRALQERTEGVPNGAGAFSVLRSMDRPLRHTAQLRQALETAQNAVKKLEELAKKEGCAFRKRAALEEARKSFNFSGGERALEEVRNASGEMREIIPALAALEAAEFGYGDPELTLEGLITEARRNEEKFLHLGEDSWEKYLAQLSRWEGRSGKRGFDFDMPESPENRPAQDDRGSLEAARETLSLESAVVRRQLEALEAILALVTGPAIHAARAALKGCTASQAEVVSKAKVRLQRTRTVKTRLQAQAALDAARVALKQASLEARPQRLILRDLLELEQIKALSPELRTAHFGHPEVSRCQEVLRDLRQEINDLGVLSHNAQHSLSVLTRESGEVSL